MINKNALLLLFLLLGISLIGVGANGMVVSQSCCFPPFCDAMDTCDFAGNGLNYDINQLTLYMGTAIFVSTLVAYSLINRK